MTDHLVVARIKSRNPNDLPRFTRMGTTQELLAELREMLPADTAYVVIPDPDGKGFSFREAFRIGLTVIPSVGQVSDAPSPAPVHWQPEPLKPPAPPKIAQDEPGRVLMADPNPTLAMDYKDTGFRFTPPRSQSELLAERGIEEPKKNLMPPREVVPTSKTKRGGKKKYPVQDPNDRDDPSIPDDKLPSTRSLSPRRRVANVKQATPEEAIAASHFNARGFAN